MAHDAQVQYCKSILTKFPDSFINKTVLDVGSYDVNGNNRYLFTNCEYIGIDVGSGKNVDVVTPCHLYEKPNESFDTIISTSCFEHDMYYEKSFKKICKLLKPGGLFCFTCGTTGQREHGTPIAYPQDSPSTIEWDYYKNLEENDIRKIINVDDIFIEYEFSSGVVDLFFGELKRMIMKAELQKQLLTKYPEFFAHIKKKIYVGEKPMVTEVKELLNQKEIVEPIQFGFECGDGWYMLLDQLMAEIQNHIENENRNRKNEFKYEILWKLQAYIHRKYYKNKNMKAFADWLYENAPRKKQDPLTVNVTQIKEKYSGLCFYYYGGNDEISGMVHLAESMSYMTCEFCGTTKNVGRTEGWLSTCCWDCLEKNERLKRLIWKPLKEKYVKL